VRELTDALNSPEAIGDAAHLQRFTRRNLTGALARRLDRLIGQSTVPTVAWNEQESFEEVER
jgi:hypothetical protein